jgi:hypothetical protein
MGKSRRRRSGARDRDSVRPVPRFPSHPEVLAPRARAGPGCVTTPKILALPGQSGFLPGQSASSPVLACCVSSEVFAVRRPSSISACRGKPQPIAKHHHAAPLNSLASSICPRLHPLSCAVSRSLWLSSTSNRKNTIHRSKNPRAPPHGVQIHHTQGLSTSLAPSTAPQTRAPTTISPGIADLAAASSSSARTRPHRGTSSSGHRFHHPTAQIDCKQPP